jgi:hypothetical protein
MILLCPAMAVAEEVGPTPSPEPAVISAPMPLPVIRPAAQVMAILPANTEVLLAMNNTVTTKGKRWSEGDTFDLNVVHDVMLGEYVVIPRGSRGVGRISWMTNKGAFGKSGKMDITLEYVEVSGRRIPVTGEYRQEGEGNTAATVGGVIAAGVFAGFITGKSGTIPQGRELMARTKQDLPLAIAGPLPAPVALTVHAAAPLIATPASAVVAETQTVAETAKSAEQPQSNEDPKAEASPKAEVAPAEEEKPIT